MSPGTEIQEIDKGQELVVKDQNLLSQEPKPHRPRAEKFTGQGRKVSLGTIAQPTGRNELPKVEESTGPKGENWSAETNLLAKSQMLIEAQKLHGNQPANEGHRSDKGKEATKMKGRSKNSCSNKKKQKATERHRR